MSNEETSQSPVQDTPKCEHQPLVTSVQQLLFEVQERSSQNQDFNGIIDADHSFLDNIEEVAADTTIGAIHALLDLLCSPKRANVQRVRDLLHSRTSSSLETSNECPVCFEDYRKLDPMSTQCGHIFCKECIIKSIEMKKQCPICAKDATEDNIIRVFL